MAKSLRNMMGAGIGAGTASLLNGTVADNLTATGSVQANALALTGDVNVLTTVPVATGVRLPALPQPGDEILIANLGANALAVYPPPGATIEGGPANAPFSLPSGAAAEFVARLGSSNWIALATAGTVAGTPVNSVLPKFIDGAGNTITAPIVGQPLFVDVGTWSSSPTSFIWQAYDDAGAIEASGTATASGDGSFVVNDVEAGHTLHVGVIASNGLSSLEALSTATSAVADIGTSGIISGTPISAFTRTSGSTVTPMTWSVTFGSNVYEGYYLHAEVFPTSSCVDGTQEQVVDHLLTHDDLQSGATIDLASDGLTSIGATKWLQLTVWTVSPNALGYSFVYPTPISPTDAVVAMTWSATDKTSGVTLSGGNLTATNTTGAGGLRASRGIGASKKVYWELTGVTAYDIAVADGSAVLTDPWGSAIDGFTPTTHAGSWLNTDGGQITYSSTIRTAAVTWTNTDVLGVALDTTVSPPVVYFSKNGTFVGGGDPVAGTGGLAMASISSPIYPGMQGAAGSVATLNPGTTPGGTAGFNTTPPTGFVAP